MEAVIGGAVGAILALICEHTYLYFKEKRQEESSRVVTFPNPSREIGKEIFHHLSPGSSIELMRSVLGTPDKKFVDEMPVFEQHREEEEGLHIHEFASDEAKHNFEASVFKATAYVYNFRNATVKITSKDGETVESLAVEVNFGHKLDASDLPLGFVASEEDGIAERMILGETVVSKDLAEQSRLEYVYSRYEHLFVCSVWTAGPLYTHYTYFGNPTGETDPDKNKPETFIGFEITGVCLHNDEISCYIPRGWDAL